MGVDVNISGTFNTVTAAARRMLAAGGGSIIITASVGGVSGHRGLPPADGLGVPIAPT